MAEDSTARTQPPERPLGERLKRTVESKILVPAAAALVSYAASYLAKKLPLILEEKVLPKLREKDAPGRVVNVVEQATETLGDRETSDSEQGSDEDGAREEEPPRSDSAGQELSEDDREEERRKREERRRERKRALQGAS